MILLSTGAADMIQNSQCKKHDEFGKFWLKCEDDMQCICQLSKRQNSDYITADKNTKTINFNFNFCPDRSWQLIKDQETSHARKTDLAATTNLNFLLGHCHVNVQGCGPCLGNDVSGSVGGVCVGIGFSPGVDIGIGARGRISFGVCAVGEHPDCIIKDDTATAAWPNLATARLPAVCQDSLVGSHDKIEVNSSRP